jgi:class 3 adenylate cyclase
MDAPPIQYTRTDDGVNIAYWTLGEGRPFVMTPWIPGCHLRGEWEVRQFRALYEGIAQSRQLVKFDPRGFGLSDRTVTKISLDTHIQDLSAVISALDAAPVDLLGSGRTSGAAMAYAAHHPEFVAHLFLWGGFADGGALAASPTYAAVTGMLMTDFEAYSEAISRSVYGWSADTESVREFAEVIRQCGTPEMIAVAHNAMAEQDVTPLLADITVPTVIIHDESGNQFSLETAQDLARQIPDARLTVRRSEPGTSVFSWLGDVCVSFLSGKAARADAQPSGFRTILFTDLESSTALTQAVGDAKAQDVLHGHNEVVRAALAAHKGEEVKHTGDGIMASFGSAVSAVEAALQIQRELASGEIRVRIGLNAGEPIAEDRDYFGTAVQLAARTCDRAEPGQVLVSNVVRELCAGKTFQFADQGEATLKGFSEPVRLFAVEPPAAAN